MLTLVYKIKKMGGEEAMKRSRTPLIMADAAYEILKSDSNITGNMFLDEDLLKERGYTDFDKYLNDPNYQPDSDLFV